MNQYLIDTNICIFFLKGRYNLSSKFTSVGPGNCFISEITLAELKFGAENSNNPTKNRTVVSDFVSGINVVPIFPALDFYAREKVRLRKAGVPIDEFDLLIGSTAVMLDLTMVTNNTAHSSRISNIKLEDWTYYKQP